MVGISGVRERKVDLVRRDGYEVVVFGDWPNWEKYYKKYLDMEFFDKDDNMVCLRPEFQWQWGQNYPELVVEDIYRELTEGGFYDQYGSNVRDWLYSDLLYRGVNKWLFVRYLLVRYKKLIADRRNIAWANYTEQKETYSLAYPLKHWISPSDWGKINYWLGYYRGMYEAYRRVRAELKTMAMTPRYVVWNNDKPGFVVDRRISRGWLALVRELYDIRFDK